MAEEHKLDRHRTFLVSNITMVNPVLDKLIQMKLLTNEQYHCVWSKATSQEQMRELFSHIHGWDDSSKDKVYQCLLEENPGVMGNLERNSQAAYLHCDIMKVDCTVASETTTKNNNLREHVYLHCDIMKVDCTGASETTTKNNNLREHGDQASCKMAERDSAKMSPYKEIIKNVAKHWNIDPAIIAGIISRSSRGGDLLIDGWGQDSFGLMQVCKTYHKLVGGWDSEEHVDQGAGILVDMINTIKRKFPDWTDTQQLKGGIAAYNCGPTAVENYDDIDKFTASKDFSNDVVARAKWFHQNWS